MSSNGKPILQDMHIDLLNISAHTHTHMYVHMSVYIYIRENELNICVLPTSLVCAKMKHLKWVIDISQSINDRELLLDVIAISLIDVHAKCGIIVCLYTV